MKRTTVLVADKYLLAAAAARVLTAAGVDAKIVTKHAVQVHPDHWERARAAAEADKREEGKNVLDSNGN